MIENMLIISNENIALNTFRCVLRGNIAQRIKMSGQFLQIKINNVYLRRPISISSYNVEKNELVIIYKVVGEGTKNLSLYNVGEKVSCFGPLGNGFDIEVLHNMKKIVVCGGGIGVPPLLGLLEQINIKYPMLVVEVVIGFKTKEYIFFDEKIRKRYHTICVTDDASKVGSAHSVIDVIKQVNDFEYIFACGPIGMLKSIEKNFTSTPMQISYEERMACGTGICMGCVKTNIDGSYSRICKEGPVLHLGGNNNE